MLVVSSADDSVYMKEYMKEFEKVEQKVKRTVASLVVYLGLVMVVQLAVV